METVFTRWILIPISEVQASNCLVIICSFLTHFCLVSLLIERLGRTFSKTLPAELFLYIRSFNAELRKNNVRLVAMCTFSITYIHVNPTHLTCNSQSISKFAKGLYSITNFFSQLLILVSGIREENWQRQGVQDSISFTVHSP